MPSLPYFGAKTDKGLFLIRASGPIEAAAKLFVLSRKFRDKVGTGLTGEMPNHPLPPEAVKAFKHLGAKEVK
jgi:hypothetical protein